MTIQQTKPDKNPAPLVLVLEDEEMLRQLIRVVLEKAGFRVLGFNTGIEAMATPLEILQEARLALVDDAMPGMSGPMAIVALHSINPQLMVVPMTGRPFSPDDMALIKPHIQQILYKPFAAADLLEITRELLA